MRPTARFFSVLLVACLGLTSAYAPSPLGAAQQSDLTAHITQVDTSRFPQVKVYISVTDASGEPVPVNPQSITLYESGQPITASQTQAVGSSEPLTTLLVMDTSGSMAKAGKLPAAQAAARAYVDQMRSGDQSGLLAFNTQITYVLPLTGDRQALAAAIDGLRTESDTALYDALLKAIDILKPVSGRKAIIALTDGMDNRSHATADQVIQQAAGGSLSISTVGLGEPSQGKASLAGLDEAALRSLAEKAGGSYAYASDATALRDLYLRYARALQSEYVISYTTPEGLRDGVSRTLSVSLGAAQPAAGQGRYNPGGLVPEVPRADSWPLFFGLLGGLVLLLFAPFLFGQGVSLVGRLAVRKPAAPQPSGRIRLKEPGSKPRIRLR